MASDNSVVIAGEGVGGGGEGIRVLNTQHREKRMCCGTVHLKPV